MFAPGPFATRAVNGAAALGCLPDLESGPSMAEGILTVGIKFGRVENLLRLLVAYLSGITQGAGGLILFGFISISEIDRSLP